MLFQGNAFFKFFFQSKSWFLEKNLHSKSCFLIFFLTVVRFKNAGNTQKLRILRSKFNQKVIFCVQIFFSKPDF